MEAMQAQFPRVVDSYDDRKLISVVIEGIAFGVEVMFEVHYPETEDPVAKVFALELLSCTQCDSRVEVDLGPQPEWKRVAIEAVSSYVVQQHKWGSYSDL